MKEEEKTEDVSGPQTKNTTPGGKKLKKSSTAAAAATPPVPSQSSNKKRGTTRKVDRERSASPPELANVEIDPDEPTYCLCDQVKKFKRPCGLLQNLFFSLSIQLN